MALDAHDLPDDPEALRQLLLRTMAQLDATREQLADGTGLRGITRGPA